MSAQDRRLDELAAFVRVRGSFFGVTPSCWPPDPLIRRNWLRPSLGAGCDWDEVISHVIREQVNDRYMAAIIAASATDSSTARVLSAYAERLITRDSADHIISVGQTQPRDAVGVMRMVRAFTTLDHFTAQGTHKRAASQLVRDLRSVSSWSTGAAFSVVCYLIAHDEFVDFDDTASTVVLTTRGRHGVRMLMHDDAAARIASPSGAISFLHYALMERVPAVSQCRLDLTVRAVEQWGTLLQERR